MAATTTVLGLLKPAYSDDSDIGDINGNMDLIDAEAAKVRGNVVADYDSAQTYAVGDLCLHDGNLEKCNTPISSPEAWNASHWTQVTIAGELTALNGKPTVTPTVVSGVDLNTITTTGTYILNGNITNSPYGNYGYLTVVANGLNNDLAQYYTNSNTADTYVRRRYSNTWSNWEKLALDSTLNNKISMSTYSNIASGDSIVIKGSGVIGGLVILRYYGPNIDRIKAYAVYRQNQYAQYVLGNIFDTSETSANKSLAFASDGSLTFVNVHSNVVQSLTVTFINAYGG